MEAIKNKIRIKNYTKSLCSGHVEFTYKFDTDDWNYNWLGDGLESNIEKFENGQYVGTKSRIYDYIKFKSLIEDLMEFKDDY